MVKIVATARILTRYAIKEYVGLNTSKDDVIENEYARLVKRSDDSMDYQNDSKIRFKICLATIVKHNNLYYLITCYHGIQDYKDVHAILYMDNAVIMQKVTEVYSLRQYDFSVLEFSDPTFGARIKGYADVDMKYKLSIANGDTLKINFIPNKNDTGRKNGLFPEFKSLSCKYVGTVMSNIRSGMYPSIPVIEIKVSDVVNPANYEGLSGSLVYDCHNNIYGMTSAYKTGSKSLYIIPSYCLRQFFMMSLSKTDTRSVCFTTQVCDIWNSKIGHEIVESHGISYKTDSDKEFKFKKEDLIESVDGIPFDDNGYILIEEFGISVPLDTYFSLTCTGSYKVKYYSKSKNKNSKGEYDRIEMTKLIQPVAIHDVLLFNSEYCDKKIKYRGLIITEMSEQLLRHYDSSGIKINGLIADYYNDCYTDTKQKIVVIIGVEYSKISDEVSEVYKKIGLPLIKATIDGYVIPIISKINNKKVNDLSDVIEMLTDNSIDATIRCELMQKIAITLQFIDDKILIK
jgi:hypothetical protein